jgi:multicomponent Na+:H+ antiporter subunit C
MAFVLTAIVITLAVTVFMLALAQIGHDDDTLHMPDTGEDHRA